MSKKRGRPTKASKVPEKHPDIHPVTGSRRIDVPMDEIEQTKADLREFYIKRGDVDGLEDKIDTIIRECIDGWNRCPKNFQARVDKKTQRNTQGWKYIEEFNAKREQLKELKIQDMETTLKVAKDQGRSTNRPSNYSESLAGISQEDLEKASVISDEEKDYYKKRELDYRSEFEFNLSSDEALLQQILIDELILRRFRFAILDGKIALAGKEMDLIAERIRNNQQKLGITREQREKERSGVGGSISDLSLALDARLKAIKAIKDKDKKLEIVNRVVEEFTDVTPEEIYQLAEELHFMKLKGLREPPNILPSDEDEVKTLLSELAI